jgi:hypothetical protein
MKATVFAPVFLFSEQLEIQFAIGNTARHAYKSASTQKTRERHAAKFSYSRVALFAKQNTRRFILCLSSPLIREEDAGTEPAVDMRKRDCRPAAEGLLKSVLSEATRLFMARLFHATPECHAGQSISAARVEEDAEMRYGCTCYRRR